MFPPTLYPYVKEVLKKDVILVLNKVDLAPAPLVVAWIHYFKQKYPELQVLCFTSFPSYNIRGESQTKTGILKLCTNIVNVQFLAYTCMDTHI